MTARGLGDEQCREMEVEDDLECECGCRISEEDCLSTQVKIFDLLENYPCVLAEMTHAIIDHHS